MAAAFAGVSGGYSANLLLGTIDPLLSGLTQEAARIVGPATTSTRPATTTSWPSRRSCSRWSAPGSPSGSSCRASAPTRARRRRTELEPLTPAEKRGLHFAFGALAASRPSCSGGLLPANGFLREIGPESVMHSPFLSSVVAFIFLGGTLLGVAYGVGADDPRDERRRGVRRRLGRRRPWAATWSWSSSPRSSSRSSTGRGWG